MWQRPMKGFSAQNIQQQCLHVGLKSSLADKVDREQHRKQQACSFCWKLSLVQAQMVEDSM